jgi:hypothetical protein
MLDMFNGYLLTNRFASLANDTGLNDTKYNVLVTSTAAPEHDDNNGQPTMRTTSGMVNTRIPTNTFRFRITVFWTMFIIHMWPILVCEFVRAKCNKICKRAHARIVL